MVSKEKVIVSLTSFPAAINYVEPTVKSLLAGSVLPDKIVLYVTMAQFGDKGLPNDLVKLAEENPVFEIRNYNSEIRSYRKLIPALKDFPDAVIVTVDDDVLYHRNMLKSLLKLHEQYPDHVIAHRAKRVRIGKPYRSWSKYRWYDFLFKKDHSAFGNLFTGVGGVLYPRRSLKENMLKEELFTSLAPTTDDIWFWAAAVANDRKIMPVPFGYNKPKGLGKPREISLKTYNFKSGVDRNTAALQAVIEKYPAIKEKVENEGKS